MTLLIIILVTVVCLSGAAWAVGRRYAARREETADDATMRELHARYLGDVEALTQAYLLQAPSDEEWLAGIRAKSTAAGTRRQSELAAHKPTLGRSRLLATGACVMPSIFLATCAGVLVAVVSVAAIAAVGVPRLVHASGWWTALGLAVVMPASLAPLMRIGYSVARSMRGTVSTTFIRVLTGDHQFLTGEHDE